MSNPGHKLFMSITTQPSLYACNCSDVYSHSQPVINLNSLFVAAVPKRL